MAAHGVSPGASNCLQQKATARNLRKHLADERAPYSRRAQTHAEPDAGAETPTSDRFRFLLADSVYNPLVHVDHRVVPLP
jgi:hypothetical protein